MKDVKRTRGRRRLMVYDLGEVIPQVFLQIILHSLHDSGISLSFYSLGRVRWSDGRVTECKECKVF